MKIIKLNLITLILIIVCCTNSQKEIINEDFFGHWAPSENDDISFTLKKDGIIKYFEDNIIYNYSIKNNRLIIREEKQLLIEYKVLKITPDTLILVTEEGNATFIKRRVIE